MIELLTAVCIIGGALLLGVLLILNAHIRSDEDYI
jgi:hypothetical protein